MRPHYRIEQRLRVSKLGRRQSSTYAVLRTGPKGGTRLVSVWDNKYIADDICAILNTNADREVTG